MLILVWLLPTPFKPSSPPVNIVVVVLLLLLLVLVFQLLLSQALQPYTYIWPPPQFSTRDQPLKKNLCAIITIDSAGARFVIKITFSKTESTMSPKFVHTKIIIINIIDTIVTQFQKISVPSLSSRGAEDQNLGTSLGAAKPTSGQARGTAFSKSCSHSSKKMDSVEF